MEDVSANDISKLLDSLVFDEERDEIFDTDDFEGVGEDELRHGEAVCCEENKNYRASFRISAVSAKLF